MIQLVSCSIRSGPSYYKLVRSTCMPRYEQRNLCCGWARNLFELLKVNVLSGFPFCMVSKQGLITSKALEPSAAQAIFIGHVYLILRLHSMVFEVERLLVWTES